MSLRTSSWLFPQNEQTRLPERSSPCLAMEPPRPPFLGSLGRAGDDHLVYEPVFDGLLAGHEEVAVGVLLDALQALSGVSGEDVVDLFAHPKDLARLDVDVGRLPLGATERLVD